MSSSYYTHTRGSWKEKVPLGYDGANPYDFAITALNIIWLLAVLGITIWAALANKSRSAVARSIFKVHKFWAAIILAILYYVFWVAYMILTLRDAEVTAAFLLVQTIFADFFYPSEIILLAIVFGLVFQLLQDPENRYRRYRAILYAHYVFCFILFALYIAIFGLQIHDLYNSVINDVESPNIVEGRPVQYVLDVVYDALSACAALEIMAISLVVLMKHRTHRSNNNIPILLIALIATPLFISRFFILGFHIAFELELAAMDALGLSIAANVIAGLGWVIQFVGLILIALQLETMDYGFDVENRILPEGEHAPSHAPPNAEPSLWSDGSSQEKRSGGIRGIKLTQWKPSMPNWNRGGKRGLGLGTAF